MTEIEVNRTNHILDGVSKCISKSTGLEIHQISQSKTLVGDLKVDSIDMMDLLYELEEEFNITIKIGELERQARAMVQNEPFEIDNVITSAGLRVLQLLMPEVSAEKFKEGLLVQQIPYLFTVKSICNIVERRLLSA